MERYPQLDKHSFKDLPSEVARQPKQSDHEKSRACDVKTFLATDADASRLAAPEKSTRAGEVESGARYDQKTAIQRYPHLNWHSLDGLPSKIVVKPKSGRQPARDVKTYLAADVDALVVRLAAPEPVDPRWLEVESGARYDARTAMKHYPQLTKDFCKGLPFEIARRPKTPTSPYACDVKTYAAADVDALAAREQARVQEPEPPQEPEPDQEEPDECPICLDPLTGATTTLVCGHLYHKDCIADWARSQTTARVPRRSRSLPTPYKATPPHSCGTGASRVTAPPVCCST
ncbi:hypothetical protein JL722_11634 [Aureococcus anophagefferens]|nr:hypothetical protein JL722_11634 [Aureococcus anophagefferens]